MFALRQEYKDQGNALIQGFGKIIMNSLNGVQKCKDFHGICKCNSEHWMETEYDDNVLDCWKLPNENYIVQSKKKQGIRW